MTSAAKKRPVKKLRIREELLPETARYVTIDDEEYVCIPVKEFGEWYEDALDGAVAEDRLENDGPAVPFEEFKNQLKRSSKSAKA